MDVDSNINLKTPMGEIFLSSKWSSSTPGHREEIRTELYKKTKEKSFLNLNELPRSENFFISISHTKSLGGYALHLNKEVGFDVEEVSRIKPNVVARISTQKDLELFNDENAHYLWVIKEAAFKMMKGECDVMTESQITQFNQVGERSYLGTLTIKGVQADFLCGEVGKTCVFALVKK